MERPAVELRVGGQTYKVRATANEDELHRLADLVDNKLREISGPDRAMAPNQLVLVAISLAHELEAERDRRRELERSWRAKLKSVLKRIDDALEEAGTEEPSSPVADPPHDGATPR